MDDASTALERLRTTGAYRRVRRLVVDAVAAAVVAVVVLGGLAALAYGVGVLITMAGGPLTLVAVWLLALTLGVAYPLVVLKLVSWVYLRVHASS